MKRKKGYTLIELVIVLGIIGILAAILVPTWMNYIAKAKVRTQNNNAKVLFNAAQKECVEMKRRNRSIEGEIKRQQAIVNDPTQSAEDRTTAQTNLDAALADRYLTSDFYFYFDGKNGYACDSTCNDISADADKNKEFADAIARNIATPKEVCYRIHIKDYNVVSVVSAYTETDHSIGSFPVTRNERTSGGIKNFDMSNAEKTYDE